MSYSDREFTERVSTCEEINLYMIIDAMGEFIWRMNHDMCDGRIEKCHWPAIDKDIARYRERSGEAVKQCVRFGVETPLLDKGSPSDNYWAWYRWWDDWKKSLSEDEWSEVNDVINSEAALTDSQVARFRPAGPLVQC